MNNKNNTLLYLFIGLIIGAFLMHLFKTYKIEKLNKDNSSNKIENYQKPNPSNPTNNSSKNDEHSGNIEELTNENTVIAYVKEHHELPDCYITKGEAKRQGWYPGQNLCDAVPGKAIGGDHFSNREGSFPKGEQYFEADVNFHCGHRQADRIIFTKNGDVWLTKDHYKSFQKQ